jgi:hypothetical protein
LTLFSRLEKRKKGKFPFSKKKKRKIYIFSKKERKEEEFL